MPVRKKNGDIRLCVDFRNLNISSLNDNYGLPNMEAMLQKVIGSELMSMMDGFSGYNQVVVKESEQFKTTFTTPGVLMFMLECLLGLPMLELLFNVQYMWLLLVLLTIFWLYIRMI